MEKVEKKEIQDRADAIAWWKSISFEEKYSKITRNKRLITGYPDRSPSSLSGREIETIWRNESKNKTS